MKIVIDISKEKYDAIKSDLYHTFPAEMKEWGLEAIRNGGPYETVTEFADRCRECGAKYGKLLKQKSCEDTISRQAVLDYIYNDLGLGDEENGQDIERLMELQSFYRYVKSLPPVNPKPKTGHWIILPPVYEEICECSNCHRRFKAALQFTCKPCPACGAEMVDKESEE